MTTLPMTSAPGDATAPGNRLRGRRIVVTGAASGIGRTIARLFSQEGATLLLLDRDGDQLSAVASELGAEHAVADISDEGEVTGAVDRGAERIGGIDGAVNAAGIMIVGPLLQMPVSAWRKTLDVNLTGTYLVIRACLPWMEKESVGTVVNIASAAGLLPNAPGLSAYAASKGGVVNLSRALAAELAPRIRVNSICPGMVDTPMADGFRNNTGNYALKRIADPLEIARAALYLTCGDSSYVTGITLPVDGGRSFH